MVCLVCIRMFLSHWPQSQSPIQRVFDMFLKESSTLRVEYTRKSLLKSSLVQIPFQQDLKVNITCRFCQKCSSMKRKVKHNSWTHKAVLRIVRSKLLLEGVYIIGLKALTITWNSTKESLIYMQRNIPSVIGPHLQKEIEILLTALWRNPRFQRRHQSPSSWVQKSVQNRSDKGMWTLSWVKYRNSFWEMLYSDFMNVPFLVYNARLQILRLFLLALGERMNSELNQRSYGSANDSL